MMRRCTWFAVVLGVGLMVLLMPVPAAAQSKKEADAALAKGRKLYQDGKYQQAKPTLENALRLFQQLEGQAGLNVGTALNELGLVHQALGQYAKAESLLRGGLKIREDKLGPKHLDVAQSLNDLGALYRDMGQYAKAEPLQLRGLKIREDKLGKDHLDVAQSLHNLAAFYRDLGQYDKAESFAQKSLKTREDKLPQNHPDIADGLNNLALVYRDQGQYARAEPFFQRSLKIYEKLRKNHPRVAVSLNNLALLYYDQRQYAKAEPFYLRSLEIDEENYGKSHPNVALNLSNLAYLYWAMGQYAKAEPFYKRSLQIYEDVLGKDHAKVAQSLHSFGQLRATQQQWSAAAELLDQARHIQQRHIQVILPLLGDQEQQDFLRLRDKSWFHTALSLGLANQADPALVALSAGWVLNGKAVTEEVAAQRARLLSAAQRGSQAPLVKDLVAIRRQLAQLTLAPANDVDSLQQRAKLEKQEKNLVQQLKKTGLAFDHTPWVDAGDVRQVLAKDQVLVEMARFTIRNFKARGNDNRRSAEHYAVWIIPAADQGDIRLIDLGQAGPIDAAVKAVLEEIQKTPGKKGTLETKGEPQAEELLQKPLKHLSALVLAPLLQHIGDSASWTLSPDGNLWLVPWEMLLLPDGSYAVEKHRIHYVNSGRYLVVKQNAGGAAVGPPRIFADPDYNLEPDQAKKVSQKLKAGEELTGELPRASPSLAGILGRVQRLPGTATEAELIKPTLTRYAGMPAKVYTDKEALKSVFLRMQRPKVLVLCTHGFYLDAGPRGKASENPLLRCGLLLAGANHFKKAVGEDDGVLTGLDVLNTDLRGTDLVVLSACETGIGDVRNGEGVAGLRQAFQLAGARAVVSSLWNVSDRETALLMNAFFDNLAKGQSKAEALRAAQLARLEKRRADFGAGHPYFWAAFTLTGISEAAPAEKAAGPVWHTDYGLARQQGKQESKPLAIFVGKGGLGFHQVSQEEALTPALLKMLAERYVCLYLDLNGAKARNLMEASGLKGERGLMVIDRTGERRVFWHEGVLSNAALLDRLSKAVK